MQVRDHDWRRVEPEWPHQLGSERAVRLCRAAQQHATYHVHELVRRGVGAEDDGLQREWPVDFAGWAGNRAVGSGPTTTITYNYSATQNNGQITQVTDQLSGETIAYQYDSLKRLTSASSSPISGRSPAGYTQTYQYDGFGNLTGKVLNGTSTPIGVNAANNRLSSASYDANGNMTSGSGATMVYDEANRIASAALVSGGIEYYGYSADNKRFYKYTASGAEQITFYGARGEKLGVYVYSMGSINPASTNIWFAGRLIIESNEPVVMDRLGTNRTGFVSAGYPFFNLTSERFYPYGDEITSTLGDHEKFATYTRDSYTGFDYADQRYYASTYGRFNTADPSTSSAGPSDPVSWNRYSYTGGDPVNRMDPRGTDWIPVNGGWCSTLNPSGGCYDPGFGDPESGGGRSGCPNFDPNVIMALQQSSMGPTLEAEAAAMGCYGAPIIEAAASDPCPGIAAKIWNTITGNGMPGGKSLLTRVVEQITGSPALFDGHQEQIDNYTNRLRNLRSDWKDNDCNGPNDPPVWAPISGSNETNWRVLQKQQREYQQYLHDLKIGAVAGAAAIAQEIAAFLASLGEGALVPVF